MGLLRLCGELASWFLLTPTLKLWRAPFRMPPETASAGLTAASAPSLRRFEDSVSTSLLRAFLSFRRRGRFLPRVTVAPTGSNICEDWQWEPRNISMPEDGYMFSLPIGPGRPESSASSRGMGLLCGALPGSNVPFSLPNTTHMHLASSLTSRAAHGAEWPDIAGKIAGATSA